MLTAALFFRVFTSFAYASGGSSLPSVAFSPGSGFTGVGEEFWVDILVNTAGQNSLSTRVVFEFDPSYFEVTKVERTNMYCNYPTGAAEYGVSNDSGYVIITGYCSSSYTNTSVPERFATVYFRALRIGDTNLNFRYNGADSPGNTVIYGTGSPPANILTVAPSVGSYKIVTDISGYTQSSPSTGVVDYVFAGVSVLVIGGGIFVYFRNRKKLK